MPTIDQGGNAFATTMEIGTIDNFQIRFKVDNTPVSGIDATGNFLGGGIKNFSTSTNSQVLTSSAGTYISRNIADNNPTLIVDQLNTSATGAIQEWRLNNNIKAIVNKSGNGTFSKIGINSTLATPTNMLDVDAGTVTGATVLGSFSQNGGTLQIQNGSGLANCFNPYIIGKLSNKSDVGLGFVAKGSDTYSVGAFSFDAKDAAGTGPVTGDNTFQLSNNGTPQLTVDYQGAVTISNLSGTGDRMVTADSTGVLSATNQVTSGSYTPTITGPDSYTLHGFRYSRIGDIVHVSGAVEVSSGSVGALSFNLGLPPSMSSTFADMFDITGVLSGLQVLGDCCVFADIINNEADVKFTTTQTLSTVFLQFDYIIQ